LPVGKVGEDDAIDEKGTNPAPTPVWRRSEDAAKALAEEVETAFAIVEFVEPAAAEEDLNAIGEKGIADIALSDAVEEFAVGDVGQGAEDDDGGDHVFGLAPAEAQGHVARGEVVERVGLRALIRADGSDLDAKLAVICAAVAKAGSLEGEDVVASGDDEVSHESLVPVDDEVTSPLFGLLVAGDELRGREAAEMTSIRLGVCVSRSRRPNCSQRTLTMIGIRPRSLASRCQYPPLMRQEMSASIFAP
jgi:hypothetical protein